MKYSILLAAVAALGLTACEKTVTNNPPPETPAAVAVPGPQGPAGAPGPQGEPGKPGDTVIVAPGAETTPPPATDSATTPPPADGAATNPSR
jgi:hypothetical protein